MSNLHSLKKKWNIATMISIILQPQQQEVSFISFYLSQIKIHSPFFNFYLFIYF